MPKKLFVKKPMSGVEHLGGRKFVQPGAEYVNKENEARRYRPGGRPHGRHQPVG